MRAEKPLAEDSFLSDDLLRQLISVGEVDLLVGIPSHNNAETIGHTVEAIEESFQRAFPRAARGDRQCGCEVRTTAPPTFF